MEATVPAAEGEAEEMEIEGVLKRRKQQFTEVFVIEVDRGIKWDDALRAHNTAVPTLDQSSTVRNLLPWHKRREADVELF